MQARTPMPPSAIGHSSPRRAQARLALTLLSLLLATGCGAEEASGAETGEAGSTPAPRGSGLVIQPAPLQEIGPGVDLADLRLNFHSFGHVPLGEKVSHVFLLKNTDDQPLTVTRMKPACGCTVPSISYVADGEPVLGKSFLTRDPEILTIPVGVTAELKITMDTHNVPIKNVDKTVGVMLTSDSPNGYYLHVETHIFVEKPFTQNPSGINFKAAPINGVTEGSTDLILNPGYDLSLSGIASLPEGMEAELIPAPSAPGNIWKLTARLLPPRELGSWQDSLFINQVTPSGEELEPLEVRMTARMVEDLITIPSRIAFGTQQATDGTPGEFSVTLKTLLSGHSFGIEELILPEDHRALFEVDFEPIDPDSSGQSGSWKVSMRCKPGVSIEKLTRGTLRLRLFDPQHPETSIEYVVHPPRS